MTKTSFAFLGMAVLSLGLVSTAKTPVQPTLQPLVAVASTGHEPVFAVDAPAGAVAETDDAEYEEVMRRYCVRCHNDRSMRGNLSLRDFDPNSPHAQPELAEKVIRKLTAGMMPPPGARRPEGETLDELRLYLEGLVDEYAEENPNPGRRNFQRLNRAEYRAAVRELFGMEVDVNAFLPAETMSNNFDNIADVQNMSATLLEGYMRAAAHVSHQALGDPNATASSSVYKIPRTASQLDRAEGAPFGTRGGLAVEHVFVADGEYVFHMELHPGPTGFLYGRTSLDEELELSIDGERVALFNIDRWMSEADPNGMRLSTEPIPVTAGPHVVAAAFVKKLEGPVDDLLTPVDHTLADTQIGDAYGVTTVPHLRDVSIVGPENVTGVSDNPIRDRIYTCRPSTPAEGPACAREILKRLGTTAYRRSMSEADVDDLMAFYELGAEMEDGDFDAGMRTALQALLTSPHFVFRIEEMPSDVAPGELYQINDVDLASRLSFFLWATAPDRELIELAEAGRLSQPDVLEAQVDRMLADPRSEALATRFASQWLRLQDLDKLHPDALLYPYYDATLADAMVRETQLFFHSLVQEDRSLLEFLTADYTFVNDRLAKHYGFSGVTSDAFQRVSYPDERRRGILGHGSVLAMTSHANRTSPVLRGKWIMEVLLGSPPPPPPPNVPELEEGGEAEGGRLLTVKEMMAQHRANPACASCHNMIDPIGLALENFDVTGAWRIKDSGNFVDIEGELFDGSSLASHHDLRNALLGKREAFVRTFTENLMAYGLGRRVEYFDMPTVREITRTAAENDYRLSEFIRGVVLSPAFRMSRAESTDEEME